jgi:hypothetical protein
MIVNTCLGCTAPSSGSNRKGKKQQVPSLPIKLLTRVEAAGEEGKKTAVARV